MFTASVNNPREDAIFGSKVKAPMVACDGSLAPALEDFQQRHAAAVAAGDAGLRQSAFMEYLRDHGVVGLSEFETKYVCNVFDNGVASQKYPTIDAAKFLHHLTGLNSRRLKAVVQAWAVVAGSGSGAPPADSVSVDALMESYRQAQSSRKTDRVESFGLGSMREVQLQQTFGSTSAGASGAAATTTSPAASAAARRLPALFAGSARRSVGGSRAAVSPGMVSKEAFIAFYAGLSLASPTDEEFEAMVLREWAADSPHRPLLQETARDWGEGGDPLAIDRTHYVHDALSMSLGRSGQGYDNSHMAQKCPYVEPLPPLDRAYIMESVAQRTYKPYDAQGYMMADPLATRRGQPM